VTIDSRAAGLILVRHAMPLVDPTVPPARWLLSPDGVAAARLLSRLRPSDAVLISSPEPKAVQTIAATANGCSVQVDERFAEVRRVGEPWDGPYRELRRAYVCGVDHHGWEPHAEVAARFDAGVRDHLAVADGRPLLIGTHGMAMTVWLAQRLGLVDQGGFWAGLSFPDAYAVDLAAASVHRVLPPVSDNS
jgi:2,3-bisphosphoglycerate-dependent phosphoglycerate mutase